MNAWLPTPEERPGTPDEPDFHEGTVYSPGETGDATEPQVVDADTDADPVLVEPGRRFVGFLLEAVLFIGTFGIGWLVWSMIEWRDARTPAKRLLRDLAVVDAWSGERVSWQRMAVRELGAKIGLVGLFGMATFGLGWVIAAALVLSETRATLWDRLAGTTVVHPGG
jgi:hypothetical protein